MMCPQYCIFLYILYITLRRPYFKQAHCIKPPLKKETGSSLSSSPLMFYSPFLFSTPQISSQLPSTPLPSSSFFFLNLLIYFSLIQYSLITPFSPSLFRVHLSPLLSSRSLPPPFLYRKEQVFQRYQPITA